jgi:hypothetical protein
MNVTQEKIYKMPIYNTHQENLLDGVYAITLTLFRLFSYRYNKQNKYDNFIFNLLQIMS